MLVTATLGAARRRTERRGRGRAAEPQPGPTPITTGRATVIEAEPVTLAEAERWLGLADSATAEVALATLSRAVRAQRIASGDATLPEPGLAQMLVVRAGYGAGEQVADGRWTMARELPPARERPRRRKSALQPRERLAGLLAGRSELLACEELTLRARHDLDAAMLREAALQLRAALGAALGELPRAIGDSAPLAARVEELRGAGPEVTTLADRALTGTLPADAAARLDQVLASLEATLRAYAAHRASS